MIICDTINKRLFAVSGIYFFEGIPDAFVYTTLAAFLAEKGVKLEVIGQVLALGTLPWTFKFLWGFVIDRFRLSTIGSRRPWIFIGQLGVAAISISLLWIKEVGVVTTTLGWLVFVQNMFAAVQDTAVDAMAVDMFPGSEKGRANGFMRASNIAGSIVGGVGMSWLITRYSWSATLRIQGAFMVVACLFTCFITEVPRILSDRERLTSSSWRELFRTVRTAFKGVTPALAAVVGVVTALASGLFSTGTSVFFIQKLGWSRDALVALSGGWSYLIGLVAALAGGFLSDRIGHRRVATAAAVCTVMVVAAFSVLQSHWSVSWLMGTLFILQSITTSILGVCMFAIYMDISWKEIAASQFCTYMAMLNLGGALGEKFIGAFVSNLGWAVTFITIAGVYALTAALLPFISVTKDQKIDC